ncbi:MAG: baseplate J/gp47 family protein [Spirulina sp.]
MGYPEALGKKLSDIALTIQWKNAPENFSDYYRDYGVEIANHSFKARVSFQDGVSWVNTSNGVQLFDSHNAALPHTLRFSARSVSGSPRITESMTIDPLNRESGVWARDNAKELVQQNPAFSGVSESEPGAIAFSLEQDFFHTTYPQKNLENILKYSQGEIDNPIILNEPYTPEIQRLSLAYKAHSDTVAIASTDLKDCAHPDLQFFHLTPFGLVREHGYQRQQIEARLQAGIGWAVPLLPQYNHAGELAIGFSSLKAGDSVSVLFQVSEGSADPDLPWEELHWFVLCDNYWKPLSRSEVVGDTTNQLRRSGIIQFLIPLEATTENTILPRDLIWIKGAIQNNVTAVCQLIEVAANAIEVQFVDRGNDPQHLLTALEPLKIEKLKHGLSAIKAVKQPYASFGGRGRESDRAFYTRVSERLRHKNRCLTAWDYERIVLAAFPRVYQVKCIPHAQENSWLAPGHVLLVVVPDLKNKNAINRLEPKVDADTLDRIADYVKKRAGMQVQIAVKNPRYQKIQLDFKVKFHVGYEFNDSRTRLAGEIIQFLSPWVDRRDRTLSFGGKIYKSVLLDFIEDLGFVDYVTDFKMYSFGGEETNHNDINEVLPATPDTILVSHSTHLIDPAIAVP